MSDGALKSDLELRFEALRKQYDDRIAQANGKPLPPHVQKWYDRQFEEFRVSLKRQGITMILSSSTAADAIARITKAKEAADAKAVPVKREKAPKPAKAEVQEPPAKRKRPHRRERQKARREQLKTLPWDHPAREAVRKCSRKYRQKKAGNPNATGELVGRHPNPNATIMDALKSHEAATIDEYTAKKREREQVKWRNRMDRINADPKKRAAYLEKERNRNLMRNRSNQLKVPTARMLVAEAAVAAFLQSEDARMMHPRLIPAYIRDLQKDLTPQERRWANNRRKSEQDIKKRLAAKVADLRSKTVEEGWTERMLKEDPVLQRHFAAYIRRAMYAIAWYRTKHNIVTTEEEWDDIMNHKIWMLKLQVDADHNFLHRVEELRSEKNNRSAQKQYESIKADPDRWKEYLKRGSKAKQEPEAALTEEEQQRHAFHRWYEVYEKARLSVEMTEAKKLA